MRVGLHVLVTHVTVQYVLVVFLHPHLTHVKGAAVVRFIEVKHFLLVDAADIANGVGE